MSSENSGVKCVLLVDDEQMIRNAGMRILKQLGCDVLLAEDGFKAVEVYRSAKARIDVVILDMTMPVMDGVSCFFALKRIDPFVRIVVSSGCMDDSRYSSLISVGAAGILPKPYNISQLTSIFDKILFQAASSAGA